MSNRDRDYLSRRESQIMDILYRLGESDVSGVVGEMPDSPSYNSVRVLLTILEKKGYLRHRKEGQRYVYSPIGSRKQVRRSALGHVLTTFFGGSHSEAILALLDMSSTRLSSDDLEEIAGWIERTKQESQR